MLPVAVDIKVIPDQVKTTLDTMAIPCIFDVIQKGNEHALKNAKCFTACCIFSKA